MSIEDDIKNQFPVLKEDFAKRAVSRLASQYAESDNFIGEIEAFANEMNLLRDAYAEILSLRWFDTAVGVILDVVGDLVGQPRVSIPDVAGKYFGFEVRPPLTPTGNLAIGVGRFKLRTDIDQGILLSDLEYKATILSRIYANYSKSTPDDISNQFFAVFGLSTFVRNYSAEIRIYISGGVPTESQRILLSYQWTDGFGQTRDFLPYTLAVGRQIRETESEFFFGFNGEPMARGFGVGGLAFNSALL